MLIKENRISWISLGTAVLIFLLLIIFRFGGIHLDHKISYFINYYTLIIICIVLFPSLLLLVKWMVKRQIKENKITVLGFFLFVLVLMLYYI